MLTLYPFQREGAAWLAPRRHGILADKMGLGKTPQAIAGAEIAGARKLGVLCPAIGRTTWAREFERWAIYDTQLRVQSYDMMALHPQLQAEWAEWKPDVLVLDECQYLKERSSRRTRMVYGQWCRGDGLVQHAGAVWPMSGTITPNHAHELYPHLRALAPDILPGTGSFADFLKEYCYFETGNHGLKVLSNKTENMPHLRMLLQQHMLRRLPEKVLPELPPVLLGELGIDEYEAADELRAMERTPEVQELLARLDDLESVPDTEPHIASFRKACGLSKARPLARMVAEELRDGQYAKIVIFAYHREVLAILMRELADFNPVLVMGGVSDKARRAAQDAFQDKPAVRVFVGQINSCSTTITLTAAHQALFAEWSWVPSDNEQAIYRLRRIGQKSHVNARMAYLANSIDEAINRSVARKVRGLLNLYGD